MLNQQPMVDASLMSLVHVTESEAGKEPQGSFKYVGQPSSSSSSGNQGPSGASSLTSIMPKPQPLGKSKIAKVISNPDMMLEQMEHLKAVFKEIETDPAKGKQGLPVMERDISLISSNPPPTWSMLQEDEVMRTSNPVVATTAASQASSKKEFIKAPPPLKPVKKTLLTDKKPGLAPTPLTVPKQSTTLESFKPRPTLFNTDRGKPFVLTVGSGKEPSSVGMDDTMKSPSDLQLEYDNRKMWEKKVMTSQQGQGQDSNPFLGKGKFNNNS